MNDVQSGEADYDYGKTRAGGVFALAGVAAALALLLVWGAWSTLEDATREHRLAEPPDLKNVVEKVEDKAHAAADRIEREGSAAARDAE
ncbi:hypothetical protein Q9K02_10985 [Qipengyuania sp. G39]|uniref:Uncharacterized protein n=1 Tax=Qipengyuania profundimaris TaxID=3067652 RepID=A0ABT9HR86_9SPHN|nr:hypothetical protein [Qipengyuania sp. G39]MDP4575663.1 hypothetical protein [Qipengyuania sp. G39]